MFKLNSSIHLDLNMMDETFKVRRYIAEYCEETEALIAEYDLVSFDLVKFQTEFNEPNSENPMFECCPIKEKNIPFIENYVAQKIAWNFNQKSYFVEASAI